MTTVFSRLTLLCCLGCATLSSICNAQDEVLAEAIAEPATTANITEDGLAAATPSKPQPRPLTVSVGLLDETRLTGTLIESNSIAIKTAFGEAAIPLSEVAGIRFPAADDTSTTIVMLNGDSITGATDLKFVSIETAWGSAKVNGANIGTLLFVPGLTWTSNQVLGGKRWTLVEASAQTPSANPQQPANVSGLSGAVGGIRVGNPQQLPPNARPQVLFGQ